MILALPGVAIVYLPWAVFAKSLGKRERGCWINILQGSSCPANIRSSFFLALVICKNNHVYDPGFPASTKNGGYFWTSPLLHITQMDSISTIASIPSTLHLFLYISIDLFKKIGNFKV